MAIKAIRLLIQESLHIDKIKGPRRDFQGSSKGRVMEEQAQKIQKGKRIKSKLNMVPQQAMD